MGEDILIQFIQQMGGFTFERGYGKQNHNFAGNGFNARRRESMYQQNQKTRGQQQQQKQEERQYSKETKKGDKGYRKNADTAHKSKSNNNNNNKWAGDKGKSKGGGKKAFRSYRIIIE